MEALTQTKISQIFRIFKKISVANYSSFVIRKYLLLGNPSVLNDCESVLKDERVRKSLYKLLWEYWRFAKVYICNISILTKVLHLKVQSWKLYNLKYMITSTQITNTEIFVFIAVLVFKLLNRKVLCINREDNRNC